MPVMGSGTCTGGGTELQLQLNTTGCPLIATRVPLPAGNQLEADSDQRVAGSFQLQLSCLLERDLRRRLERSLALRNFSCEELQARRQRTERPFRLPRRATSPNVLPDDRLAWKQSELCDYRQASPRASPWKHDLSRRISNCGDDLTGIPEMKRRRLGAFIHQADPKSYRGAAYHFVRRAGNTKSNGADFCTRIGLCRFAARSG